MKVVAALGFLILLGHSAMAQSAEPSSPARVHLVYGTISKVDGPTLVLRLRNGRDQRVDDSPALAAGTYSAPLFVGKAVVVAGTYDGQGVLHASAVTKLGNLDSSVPADR